MGIEWTKYDASFLYSLIHSDPKLSDRQRQNAEANSDDVYTLTGLIEACYPRVDPAFIKNKRTIIEQELLKAYPDEVKKICEANGIKGRSENDRQLNMTMATMTNSLAHDYISAMKNISGSMIPIDKYSKFKHAIGLKMSNVPVPEVPLHDYQKDAVAALKKHFVEDDKDAGILVMPTGSGKSRTAIYFLIKEMIGREYQILWIAHRHMLLDQAAENFYSFSGLSKVERPGIRNYRISCISGKHMRSSQVGDSEVVIASIDSICRNKDHLKRFLAKKVMIVVDECHHTFAPSYRDVVSFVRKRRKDVKLLGLTATPVRANEDDSAKLLRLYDDNIIYSVSMSNLISKGILAKPEYERVETGKNFESVISQNEANHINKYGELPATLISKIASSRERNGFIVKKYLDNKEKYGKTLIFAMDVTHCRLLDDELRKAKVKSGAIYNGNSDNDTIIKKFKNNELDVLVNVNIMTEGSDVPDIQTVMLTRPTSSEGFLIQMIGRGMRGLAAKGTETVNIIDFHDVWDTFNKWLNPEWIIGEELEEDEVKRTEYHKRMMNYYDWNLCLNAYYSILKTDYSYTSIVAIPSAWYSLIDEEGEPYSLLIFENQLKGYEELRRDKNKWIDKDIDPDIMIRKYFSYFCNHPSRRDIEMLVYNFKNNEDVPTIQMHEFKDRRKIEPLYVAREIKEKNMDLQKTAEELYDEYEIARTIYQSKEDYTEAVKNAMNSDEETVGFKVEELPLEFIPYELGPCYDIDELYKEVVDQMFEGSYPGISSVEWTDKPYKTYYGQHDSRDHSIKINKILDNKIVKPEVIKYVIYHELLHRDYRKHDKAFYEQEHKYPNYAELDHFLDAEFKKYDITNK